MDDLIRDFVAETLESLDPVESAVLRLDGPVCGALHARTFRLLHTIKGTCGFLALPKLEAAAHAGEDRLATPDNSVDAVVVLKILDEIRSILSHLSVHGVEPAELAGPEALDEQVVVKSPGALISAERLEKLLADVAELAIVRAQLVSAVERSEVPHLREPVQRMSHVVDLIESRVVAATMQRIEAAWRHAPRVARDIARAQGKDILVELSGGNVEIDRAAFMALRDSIVHLVRNAAGHGIETIEDRRAVGKPAQGTIRLSARQGAEALVVTVSDDGRGLAQGTRQPGEVTLLSGRGVGLTAVRETIAAVGGTLDVRSLPGRGVTFDIRLPLVAGVAPYMLLTCGDARFAIPQTTVLEVAMRPAGVASGRFSSRHGDVRLCQLRQLLQLASPAGETEVVVVCEEQGQRFGVVADRAWDCTALSIKPMAGTAADIRAFDGAALDSKGRVVLALNMPALAESHGESIAAVISAPAIAASGQRLLGFAAGDGKRRYILLSELVGVALEGQRSSTRAVSRMVPAVPSMLGDDTRRRPLLLVAEQDGLTGIIVDSIGDIECHETVNAGSLDASGFRLFTACGEKRYLLDVEALRARQPRAAIAVPQVVILEDDVFCREFLQDLIEGFGYSAGFDGSALSRGGRVLVVDLDNDRQLGDVPARILNQAIGISSRLDGGAARRARTLGITDVIGKFDRASLRQMLERRIPAQEAA